MSEQKAAAPITKEKLIDLLNEDLQREYQADHRLCELLAGA